MPVHFVTDAKIAETSSKGNQEKWLENGRWYKLDQFGYEALAEVFASLLLEHSDLERDTPFSFVRYRMERIHVHGRERTGCSSESFLRPGEAIITLAHLYRRCLDKPLKDVLSRLTSDRKRIAYLAEMTAELTGLTQFPAYLTALFEADALVLNDDRHLNNIAVLERDGRYGYCPIFDNGAGFLSNVQLAPMDIAPRGLIPTVKARPFRTTFNRQVIAARGLSGPQLQMPRFSRGQLWEMVQPLLAYYPARDQGLIADRVCETVLARQKAF